MKTIPIKQVDLRAYGCTKPVVAIVLPEAVSIGLTLAHRRKHAEKA